MEAQTLINFLKEQGVWEQAKIEIEAFHHRDVNQVIKEALGLHHEWVVAGLFQYEMTKDGTEFWLYYAQEFRSFYLKSLKN